MANYHFKTAAMKTMPPHLQRLTTLLPQGIAVGGDTELESNIPTDGMFEKRVMSHDWQITRDATVRIIEQTISIWSALGLFSKRFLQFNAKRFCKNAT